jgi:hypothetical protein
MIQVRRIGDHELEVLVREGRGETHHQVTMMHKTCERLTGGKDTPECCIEATFCFLLDHEPKEAILRRFDVTIISRYFPGFERELPRYLSAKMQADGPDEGGRKPLRRVVALLVLIMLAAGGPLAGVVTGEPMP